MCWSWKPSGSFRSPVAVVEVGTTCTSDAAGDFTTSLAASLRSAGIAGPLASQVLSPNQSLSFVPILKRLVSPSISITKSRILPPFRPPRLLTQEVEKQSHTHPLSLKV